MTKKTEVATVTAGGLPAYLQDMSGPATLDDNFDSDDLMLPRIALLQGTSDVCKENPAAMPGKFWHTGFDQIVDPLKFVICSRHKKIMLIAPQSDGRGVLARAEDARTWDSLGSWDVVLDRNSGRTAKWEINDLDVAASGLLLWGSSDPEFDNNPPAATTFYEYAVIFPDEPDLGMAIISLSRSAIKRAKQGLNDKIALHASNGRPLQSLVFEASPTVERGDAGDYYNWRFTGAGFAPEGVYERAVINAATMRRFRAEDEDGPAESVKRPPATAPVAEVDPDDEIPF